MARARHKALFQQSNRLDLAVRILFWTELFWPHVGGIQTLASQMIPLLRQRGYEFVVVTSHADHDLPDRMVSDGTLVYRFPFWQALYDKNMELLARAIKGVIELKRAFKPDLIHLNFPDPTVFFHWQTAQQHAAPTLASLHLALPEAESDKHSLVRQTLISAQWVTAASQALLNQARLRVPEIACRTTVLYPGIKTPSSRVQPLSFDRPKLLCVGRLAHGKGFDLALSAFKLISTRYKKLRVVIAGDGPARSDLENQATTLGIRSWVEFLGWVEPSRMPDLLNSATIVSVPSRHEEAFPLVALEAALMARPVVATRVGGLPESIIDHETGLIVETENPAKLAAAIAFCLDNSEVATRMGEAGRLRASALFGLDRYADESDALYKKIRSEWQLVQS